jgi:hypothetical protein
LISPSGLRFPISARIEEKIVKKIGKGNRDGAAESKNPRRPRKKSGMRTHL